MNYTEEGQHRPSDGDADRAAPAAAAGIAPVTPRAPARPLRGTLVGLACFAIAIVLTVVGYVATAAPGSWFPSAQPKSWAPSAISVLRGRALLNGDVLEFAAGDPSGMVVISINAKIRAADYRGFAWDIAGVPAQADVWMVWRSDYAPAKTNSLPVTVVAGRLQPVDLSGSATWIGGISGIGLAFRTPPSAPMQLRGVLAKPMGAMELLRDRAGEWFAFERWSGTSINVVAGGASVQDAPLPTFLAVTAVLAMLASLLLLRRPDRIAGLPLALGAIFVAAWFAADTRWQVNLARQVAATYDRYAGKDWHDRHVAAEDGALFTFIEHARAKLPAAPARVFMVAEAHYFRDRGAYHLYPHNVWFDPYRDAVPPASAMKSGDYLVVYQRRGIQYDAALQRLRLPDGTTIPAEAMLAERGGALFRLL
jgi:hypothetical protein